MNFREEQHVLVYNTPGVEAGTKARVVAAYEGWSVVGEGNRWTLCIDNKNLREVDVEGHG